MVFISTIISVAFGGGLNFFLLNPGQGEGNVDNVTGQACTGLVSAEEGVCIMTYQCLRAKGRFYFYGLATLYIILLLCQSMLRNEKKGCFIILNIVLKKYDQ